MKVQKIRIERHDVNREVAYDPTTQTHFTALDDCKKFDFVRTDIMLINIWTDENELHKQFAITPKLDGGYYIPNGLEHLLTEDDMQWLLEEARLCAETAKQYPDFAKHLC